MKIKLHNFGHLYRFVLDTHQPFHFIYGKNNVGKSYALRATYLIVKNILEQSQLYKAYLWELMETKHSHVQSLVDDLQFAVAQKNTTPIDLRYCIEKMIDEVMNRMLIPALQRSFQHTFSDDLQNKASVEACEIILETQALQLRIRQGSNQRWHINEIKLPMRYEAAFHRKRKKVTQTEHQTTLFINPDEVEVERLKEEVISVTLAVIQRFFQSLTKHIDGVYFLPDTRAGLYHTMRAFGTIFTQLSQRRYSDDIPVTIPAFPEPVSDYFLTLSRIQPNNQQDRFTHYAQQIERHIFDAQIVYDTTTHELAYYRRKSGLRLRITEASTLIAALAPLVAYLKFEIGQALDVDQLDIFSNIQGKTTPKQKLLFIEEPEAHLHLNFQNQLLDLLIQMSRKDLRFICASHSGFMYQQLLRRREENKVMRDHLSILPLKTTSLGSIIDIPTPAIEDIFIDFEDHSNELKDKMRTLGGES
ncbi:MAG: AAA family ATPase [Thermonemataceae bacterium]